MAARDRKTAEPTGLDPAFGEPVRGQQYTPHTDHVEPNSRDYGLHCSTAGNRTWTVMIYLNDVEGVTRFTTIRHRVRPALGTLLAWNNRLPDGGVDPATLHHGMKVRAGRRYIVTTGSRELPWG